MKCLVRPFLLLTNLVLLMGTISLTSCTVKTGSQITKVNPYHLQPGYRPRTADPMIDFEYRRKTFGAVDSADYRERYGNYFTVYWKIVRRELPVTVRLEYRQAKTGPKVFAVEELVDAPRRTNTTNFEIIGDEYAENGTVTQWKATILQEGAIVDEFKSFLWQ